MQARVKTAKYGLARSLFQFFIIAMAVFCALSRVSNYKHHWSDVLAGTILGIVTATIIVSNMVNCDNKKMFKRVKCND